MIGQYFLQFTTYDSIVKPALTIGNVIITRKERF